MILNYNYCYKLLSSLYSLDLKLFYNFIILLLAENYIKPLTIFTPFEVSLTHEIQDAFKTFIKLGCWLSTDISSSNDKLSPELDKGQEVNEGRIKYLRHKRRQSRKGKDAALTDLTTTTSPQHVANVRKKQ